MESLQKAVIMKKISNEKELYIILALTSFIFFNFLILSLTILSYPYDLDITEGFLLIPSIKILQGKGLYTNIHSPPYYFIEKYPPIFYSFNTLTIIFFGTNLFSARIISFVASLLIGLVILLIMKKKTNNELLQLSAFLFFFSSYVIIQIATQVRVDALGSLFSLLGIYFIMDYKKKKNFYLAIVFFLASIFTKQTFLAASLASFLYIFMEDKKKSIKFFTFIIISTIAFFLLINFLSNGQFIFHVLKSSAGIIEPSIQFLFSRLSGSLIIICIGIYFFLKNRKDILSLYFLFSLIILVVQFTRTGAWINYLFELTAITSIFPFLLIKNINLKTGKVFIIFLVILQIFIFVKNDPRSMSFIIWPNSYTPNINVNSDEKISSYVKNSTGNILVEHATFAIINKKEIPPELWSIIELEQLNIINNSEIINFVKNQNYSMIIYYKKDRVPQIKDLNEYILKNYKLIDEIPWVDQAFHNETWKVYSMKNN